MAKPDNKRDIRLRVEVEVHPADGVVVSYYISPRGLPGEGSPKRAAIARIWSEQFIRGMTGLYKEGANG